jgi:hypothetical protein
VVGSRTATSVPALQSPARSCSTSLSPPHPHVHRSCPDKLSPQRTHYHLGVAKESRSCPWWPSSRWGTSRSPCNSWLCHSGQAVIRAPIRHSHAYLGVQRPCTGGAVRAPPRGAARSAARPYPCRAEERCAPLARKGGRHASAPRCSLTHWSMSGSWLPARTDVARRVAIQALNLLRVAWSRTCVIVTAHPCSRSAAATCVAMRRI